MEALFMQAFERQEAAEAQMRQQAASYSQNLTCALLAAGHLPPPWLPLHPAALAAALDRGGAAEARMRMQAEAYSRSLARALVAAGHPPPPWLLPHRADAGALERRAGVEAQMRQQVASYSKSLARALLAAGHRPPAWLLQAPADVDTHGNTVSKLLVGLANPRSVDHVHHLSTEINHQVKQKTLEVVGVKPCTMNISSSADRRQKCASETVTDSTGTHSSNENPSTANSLEVPHSGVSFLLQNETLHPVEADLCEVPQPITILLPEKETTHAAESEPLDGPKSSTTPQLETTGNAVRKVSVDLANPECADHLKHVLPEINHQEKTPGAVDVKRVIMNTTSSAEANQCQKCTRETVIDSMGMCALSEDRSPANSVEVPHPALSSLLQNDTLHSVDVDFDEAPHPITTTSPQKETAHTAETEPVEDPRSIATPLLKIDSLHSVKPNFLEGLDSLGATNPENDSVDTAENNSLELSHSMVSLLVEKGTLHSDKDNILEGNNSIDTLFDKEIILTDSVEGAHSPLREKDTLHCVHTNHHQGNYFMSSVLLDKEITDAVEGPSSMASPLVENGSSHSTKSNFLEGSDCVSSRLPENGAIETVENVSIEVSQCTTSVQFENGKLHSAVYIEAPHDTESSIASLLLGKGSVSAESLEGPHCMASPQVGNDISHSAKTVFLQGTYSNSSLLLDKEAVHTSETTSLEGPFCLVTLVTPKIEKDPLNTIDHTVKLIKRSSLLDRCDNESSRILEHQSSGCHVVPVPINESALQPYQLADNTSEADDVCAWNNIDISTRAEARSTASCKSARALHIAEGNIKRSTDLQHHGTGQTIGCFDNAMEINVDSCTTEATPTDSLEGPHYLANPLLEKAALHSVQTDFLEAPYSVPSTLLDADAGHTSEMSSVEGLYFSVSPQIENDPLYAVEHAEQLRKRTSLSDRSIKGTPKILEQKHSGCIMPRAPFNESSLQPDQLPDTASEVPEMLDMPQVNVLEDKCGSFSCSHENMLEDDLGSLHLHENEDGCECGLCSHPGTFRCSLARSVSDLDKLQPKHTDDGDGITNSIVSSGTIITQNDSSIDGSSTGSAKDAFISHSGSSTGSAKDAFISAESESSQMQSSVSKTSLECVMTGKAVEAVVATTVLFTSVESIQRESALDSIQCQPKQSDHAHAKFSDKDKSEMPNISSGASSKIAGALLTAESDITTNESFQTVTDRQNNSAGPSYDHLYTSVSGEKFSSLEPHVQRTASHLDKSSASGIQVTQNSYCENAATNNQSDNEIYDSSSTMSTSSSLDNQDDLLGKALPSHSYLSRSGSRECISPNSERSNASNQTSPLAHEVQEGANYSPESGMSNLSEPICCNSPSWQASLCSGSSLNTKVTTIHQHSRSYSLANKLDTAFASLASCSDFQADGERHYLRQENSSIECPNGGVKTARAEDYSIFDETMQECQSFSIPVPSNSLAINHRASQAFCESKELINLSSSLSAKYKMKPLDGVYQSLPSRFEKLMNRSLAYSTDTNLLDPSYDSKKLGGFGNYSLDFDGAFMTSNDLTCDSSNAYGVLEDSDVPLTHSVEKYNLEKLSGRTGSSSDYLGSIPELACFRIDEDSTILRENENQMKLSGSIGRNYPTPRQGLAANKPLGYATNIYQSKGISHVDLIAGKSYTRKPDRDVHIRVNQDIKNPKENRAPSIKKGGKVTHPLLDRLSKTEMLSSKSERNISETNPGKGCRPRSIVSNMTSFIPLVKQKQRPPTSCVKRDVRVRALEAAEAAKRREEKKQTDRERRKAAVELERERLKQEKEHRQKQVEQQKKKDADIITRKRQRENDGKRGNARKKKCVEEAPKHQKQQLEIMHSTNAVGDACPNDTDGKDPVENLVRGVKNHFFFDENMESVHRLTSESNSLKAVSVDWNSEGSKLQVQGSWSDDVHKSYEMSPYEDSDEEDFDNLDHKRELRRTLKLIPSWAQKENFNKILLSNQASDPREVFAHKCSFILSDVLTLGIPHRLFN